MKVLFESSWWNSGPPSGRNVVRSTFDAWKASFPDDVVVRSDVASDVGGRVRHVRRRLPTQALRSLLLDARAHDFVLTQNFSAQQKGLALQGTFLHDVMWTRHPEWFTAKERLYLRGIRPSLRKADVIFTSSHTEADQIRRVWPETSTRLRVTGLAVPDSLRRAETRPRANFVGMGPFLLSVGRLNRRKNIRRLLDAYELVVSEESDLSLIVVGSPDGASENLNIPDRLRDRVLFTGRVTDGELRWLYESAQVFAFPSLDEGYGLPLIEAQAFNTPTAASDIPIFREVGADSYFRPEDPRAIGEAVMKALETRLNPPVRHETWDDVVRAMRVALVRSS